MKSILRANVLGAFLAVLLTSAMAVAGDRSGNDVETLLKLHQEVLDAHKARNVERLLAPEPDQSIIVSRGEVLRPTKEEQIPRFEEYLGSTEFSEYRDLIDPIVRVSDDGSMGWLICQVKVAGTQTDDDGAQVDFDVVWAWIELYEKRDGRWYRVGNVSNRKLDDS